MGNESRIRFIIRSILLAVVIILFIKDKNIIINILNYKIIFNIKVISFMILSFVPV